MDSRLLRQDERRIVDGKIAEGQCAAGARHVFLRDRPDPSRNYVHEDRFFQMGAWKGKLDLPRCVRFGGDPASIPIDEQILTAFLIPESEPRDGRDPASLFRIFRSQPDRTGRGNAAESDGLRRRRQRH